MAKNKKPKFLEKETPELLEMLKAALDGDTVDIPRALKITEELIARQPGEEQPPSVDEALHQAADIMTEALNKVKEAYDAEVASLDDDGDDEDEDESAPAPKKDKKSKKGKKAPEPEEDEDEEEDEDSDEDEEEEDYSDWSLKDLKKECRTRGIKVTKGMSKAEMVKALEADDKE